MSDVLTERGYVRLNILLPEDTLAKIDVLKEKAGLVSRGRTIQELVEVVWDLQTDCRNILEVWKNPPNDIESRLTRMLPWLVNILRRIGRFS